jgi:hypothetical protein
LWFSVDAEIDIAVHSSISVFGWDRVDMGWPVGCIFYFRETNARYPGIKHNKILQALLAERQMEFPGWKQIWEQWHQGMIKQTIFKWMQACKADQYEDNGTFSRGHVPRWVHFKVLNACVVLQALEEGRSHPFTDHTEWLWVGFMCG